MKLAPVLLLLASGCKVIDAPDALEDLVVFGFGHYDEDVDYLEATHVELVPAVELHLEDLADGYSVNDLTSGDLEKVGVKGADVSNIIGALATVRYDHPLEDVIGVLTMKNKTNVFEDTLTYEVLESSDRPCFLARECERYDARVHEVTQVPILGEAERTFDISYRWVETDDGWAVYQRTLNPNPITFSSNILVVHQQYQLVALFPDGQGVRRVEAFWVDAEIIGVDIPESMAIDQTVGTMQAQAEEVDAYLDAQ